MKKILCAILMLCLTLPTFAACSAGGEGNITDTSNVDTTDTGEPDLPAEVLDIIKEKKQHFQNYLLALPHRSSYSDPLLSFFKGNRRAAIIFHQNRTGKPQRP